MLGRKSSAVQLQKVQRILTVHNINSVVLEMQTTQAKLEKVVGRKEVSSQKQSKLLISLVIVNHSEHLDNYQADT